MTIRNVQIHGTGVTVGEVIDAAVAAGGGGGGGSYTLPVATDTVLGGVKIGDGVSVTGDGTISVAGGGGSGTGFAANESGDTLTLQGEAGTANRTGQSVHITAGDDGTEGQQGAGEIVLISGSDFAGGGAGNINVLAGSASTDGIWGGSISLNTGQAPINGSGGSLSITTGNGTGTGNTGGHIKLHLGSGSGGATTGLFKVENLPTADPHVVNAIWSDAGTLKISAG